jgi:uncharacterized protein YegL
MSDRLGSDRLGGAVVRKPLHFIFVLDLSGSMLRGGRIQALNNAMSEVVPILRDEALANPHAQLLVRVLGFATETRWIVDEPTPIEDFHWQRLNAIPQGMTELGLALQDLAAAMRDLETASGAFPPAIVLVSDGRPTHSRGPHFSEGLQEFLNETAGGSAVRLALGVGHDADMNALRRFVGNEDVPLLRADNPEQLVEYIIWASKAASRGASMPPVGQNGPTYAAPLATGDPIWSTQG